MRAIWKGTISFGLVSIPVQLYTATEEKNIRFHQVHRSDGGRVRYQRVCAVDGQEVRYEDLAKGYQVSPDQMVVLTDTDLADLPLTSSRAIEVLEFVPTSQVDPILFHKAYYLEPSAAAKPYLLLRDALTKSDRVAIVKVALRQREQLAMLRVRDGVMVLNTLLWPDEVRTPDFEFLGKEYQAKPAELAMAGSLIDSMSADFSPEAYPDDYREALQAVIDAKVAGQEVVTPAGPAAATEATIDLMAALRASVERARAAVPVGGDQGDHEGPAVAPTPIDTRQRASKPRKTGQRKAPARKPHAA